MHLRSLGRLSLEGADFPYPKLLLLLVYLSLAGPQPRRRLAALFWPRATDARNRLSVSLSRIQKKLPGAIRSDAERVSTSLVVDATVVAAALAAGRREEAIAAYAGHFLDGAALTGVSEELAEWVIATGDDLARAVQHAHLTLAEGAAAEGGFQRAVAHAEAVLAVGDASLLDPADLQRLHTLLVAGGSPRAADARNEAEAFELELASSQQQARAWLRPADHGGSGRVAAEQRLEPPAPTLLLGREEELAELARYLRADDHRLITLIGPGGIGKSRLAEQAAAAAAAGGYAGRTAFVRLEEVASPEELPTALADALGAAVPAGADPLEGVCRLLAQEGFLLVLDNFEHLVSAAPRLLELLARCPGLRLLVTSREPLAVAAEWQVRVEGLRYPAGDELRAADAASWPALALFEARARRVDHRFSLDEADLGEVAAICRACLGSPLALELAASWVGVMTPADIVEEMSADIDLLQDARRDADARHRSIRAVFEHSWRLLSGAERSLFRRLAVFRGGFDRQAARVVAGADAATLAALVGKSFVVRRTARRYERHPLLSQFGLEKLAEEPAEQAEASARHARYMRGLALMAHPHLHDPAGAAWRERLEQEQANLTLALSWARDSGDAEMLLDMIEALCDFWIWRGLADEALAWTRSALALSGRVADPRRYLHMLLRTTFLCVVHGDHDSPAGLLEEGLVLAREIGGGGDEARLWSHRGIVAVYRGEYALARAFYERALEQAQAADRADVVARVLNNLADLHAFQGEHAAARPLYLRSLQLERRLGDRQMESNVLGSLALTALRLGEPVTAEKLLRESVALAVSLGITFSLPAALEQYAQLAAAVGRWSDGARLWGAAEALRDALRTPLEPFTRPVLDAWLAAAGDELGAQALSQAWAAGRQWPAEQAVAWALRTRFVPVPTGDASSLTAAAPEQREPLAASALIPWEADERPARDHERPAGMEQN